MSKNNRRLAAVEANFNSHSAVCTERAGNVNDKLTDLQNSFREMKNTIALNAVQHTLSVNIINNKLFGGLVILVLLAVGALATVIFWMLTRH